MKFSKKFSGRQHAINKFFMNILSLRALRQHNKLWVFIAAAVVYILLVVALEQHFPVNFTFNIIIINSGIQELWGSMKSQGRSSVDTMFTKCYFSTPIGSIKLQTSFSNIENSMLPFLKRKPQIQQKFVLRVSWSCQVYYHASAAGKKYQSSAIFLCDKINSLTFDGVFRFLLCCGFDELLSLHLLLPLTPTHILSNKTCYLFYNIQQ